MQARASMNASWVSRVVMVLALTLAAPLFAATSSNEEVIAKLLEFREVLARDAIAKAIALDREGKSAGALGALTDLERIRPIDDIPISGLICVDSAVNGKTGNTRKQLALRGLLFGISQAIAHSGDGPTSPLNKP